ncbi:hypothetical protein [Arcobacter defluvii]|uniref:Membrane protein n=1 Tax=Arcobacter defluvii TaxID=873191 RepID=A0AAE7BHX7_9BACT|nr:hypothetical protein [Arcobacter defluvii]QKF78084.1 putative membrane protein [Arcobacter defluvii]RXI33195.1 hypothetical protein CP964_06375 [Arcobacter defluvii]
MKISDVEKLASIYLDGIKSYKTMCDEILKKDTKINNELFLLLLAVFDSMETLAILSRYNKMRDSYVISRVIYETTVNILLILSTDFESMDEMNVYTQNEINQEPARSIAIDSEAVFLTFDGKEHIVGFSKNNPFSVKNPRNWTKHNLKNSINLIDKKYGKIVSRSLMVAHLVIYRTSSNIAHGTLYGMLQAMGLIHGKTIKEFSDISMVEHNSNVIATLLLTTLQSVYGIVYVITKEIDLKINHLEYYTNLEKLIKEGKKLFSKENKRKY